SAASILVLACMPAFDRRLIMPVPPIGAGASVLALALIVVGIWAEPSREGYWKTMGTLLVAGAWAALTSLLALVPLAPRYRWTFRVAAGLALVLASIGVVAMWTTPSSDAFGRVGAGVAVLTAAFVIAVPVLSRASRGETKREPAPEAPAGFCPRCGFG